MISRLKYFIFVIGLAGMITAVDAEVVGSVQYSLERAESKSKRKEWLVLPYVFSSESMGFTYGVGGGARGYLQEQLLVGGTVFGSVDDAKGGLFGLWNLRVPGLQRLYFSALGARCEYPRQRSYVSEFPSIDDATRAGSNNSASDDYTEGKGASDWLDMRLDCMLPLGSVRNHPIAHYQLERGLLVSGASGGAAWNPLSSGVSVLSLRQVNEYRSYEGTNLIDRTVHPIQLGLLYDNTDFPVNPSFGSKQAIGIMRDTAWGESDTPWTFLEFEYSKYIDLGSSDLARQRVLAFDFWTGSAPTWKEKTGPDGELELSGNPAFFEGANLGGFYRMRGYPQYRFHDRSVIYTAAEYRYTVNWNPIKNIRFLSFLKMDWWQAVAFVEGGRVANEYSFSELTSHWKSDIGFGLRAMFAGAVVRFDMGFSDEGSAGWFMAGHPF